MTDSPAPTPYGPRDRALNTLEQIRAALTSNNLPEALNQISILQSDLAEWKRNEARSWLDAALRGDLLLFNSEAANQRLKQWQSAVISDDEPELKHYQERVQERARQKQSELQARGVIAHCQELWQQAAALEHSDQPAHPDFVLSNYYAKVRDIAAAACAEYPDNASLDVLMQQTERLRKYKSTARKIYKMALENDRYEQALDELSRLEDIDLIPRFWVNQDQSGDLTSFERMIPINEAKAEIERLGRAWAADRASTMQQSAEELLQAYRPKQAIEALADRQKLERFINEAARQKLYLLENRAREDANLLEQAERRAHQAMRLIAENPMNAWSLYSEAYRTYAGAPSLNETRQKIIEAMLMQLEQMIHSAEVDFENKHMGRITESYQRARLDYADKDPILDEVLANFEEIAQQVGLYEEYLRNAHSLLQQIQASAAHDLNQAAALLEQLEQYPGLVLEELHELPELRESLRQRLNAENTPPPTHAQQTRDE